MFIMFYDDIDAMEHSNVSNEDKKTLTDFLELFDTYKYEPDKFPNYTSEELNQIFQIAKFSPSLQIKMWKMLPDDIVNNPENIEIFKNVLDNKFGEYINGIDKGALVRILNTSRSKSRRNG